MDGHEVRPWNQREPRPDGDGPHHRRPDCFRRPRHQPRQLRRLGDRIINLGDCDPCGWCAVNAGTCTYGGGCLVKTNWCTDFGNCEVNTGWCLGGNCTVDVGLLNKAHCYGGCDVNFGYCGTFGRCLVNTGWC